MQTTGPIGGILTTDPVALVPAQPLSDRTRQYLAASKAPATVRAYRSDLRHFEAWCDGRGSPSLPSTPEVIADYLAELAGAGMAAATITRRLTAISQAHRMAGLESPTGSQVVRMTAAGIRRSVGTAQHQVRPILVADLRAMLEALPADLRGLRDRALLLIGFTAGLRRSELVALDVTDVVEEAEGLRVTIRRSKTDQEGAGREVGILRGRRPSTDPVGALSAWCGAAGIASGPIFREVDRADRVGTSRLSDRGVARIVKRSAARVGIDPASVSGHSLRSGLATSAAAGGAPERAIMRTTGHRSEAMVRRYIRAASVFSDNAGHYLAGL
ncbi:MAG: site-specific integrase [Chloroflexota bacterium]